MVPSAAVALAEPKVMLHWPRPGELNSQRPAIGVGGALGCENTPELAPGVVPRPSVLQPASESAATRKIDARNASVADRKFARVLSLLRSELPNLSDTSKPMILVSLLNPKFAMVPAGQSRELRIRDTRPGSCMRLRSLHRGNPEFGTLLGA